MSGGALALAPGVADVGADDMPPLGAGTEDAGPNCGFALGTGAEDVVTDGGTAIGAGTRDAGEFALDAGVGAGTATNIRKSRTHQHHAPARKRLEREAVENKAKWQEKII
jgi:hypothetical protein